MTQHYQMVRWIDIKINDYFSYYNNKNNKFICQEKSLHNYRYPLIISYLNNAVQENEKENN